MHWANLDRLRPHDEVKFVIKDRADYEYARDVVARHELTGRARRGAVLAGPRRARPAGSWRSGSSRIACRSALQLQAAQVHLGARRRAASDARVPSLLLSGGLDSYTAAAIAQADGFDALRADDPLRPGPRARGRGGARGRARRSASRATSSSTSTSSAFGGSALVGDGAIPKDRARSTRADIPSTYVPARNTVFLSLALAGPRCSAPTRIVIGVNALDYSGYPDCRPEYLARVRAAGRAGDARPASKAARLRILAPLLQLSKADIIRRGLALGLDYGLTHSCYDPGADGRAVRPLRQLPAARARASRRPALTDPALLRTARAMPMTERLYYTDPYLREFDATRRRAYDARRRAARVVLDRTAFYPTPAASRSTPARFGDARVVDVVDAERRRDAARRRSRCRTATRGARRDRLGAALRSHAAAHRAARAVGGVRSAARRRGP